MRYRLSLCYKGTNYHGWQRQPNAISVQQVLEDSINLIFRDCVEITGCGRTDTGVHARFYTAHFDSEKIYNNESLRKLNRYLPKDISIFSIEPTNLDFHARFSAIERSYEYVITLRNDPFLNGFSWQLHHDLRTDLMQQAILKLFNYTDFTSFSKLHTDVNNNNCKIMAAEVVRQGYNIFIRISADRFLRNMVRAIVGTLVDVGREKISIDEFCRIVEAQDRNVAGQSVPAEGLFLVDVKY